MGTIFFLNSVIVSSYEGNRDSQTIANLQEHIYHLPQYEAIPPKRTDNVFSVKLISVFMLAEDTMCRPSVYRLHIVLTTDSLVKIECLPHPFSNAPNIIQFIEELPKLFLLSPLYIRTVENCVKIFSQLPVVELFSHRDT